MNTPREGRRLAFQEGGIGREGHALAPMAASEARIDCSPAGASTGATLLNPYFLQVFGICLFGWTLANMDQAFFGYAIPPIKETFAIGDPEIGLILSASFLAAAFFVVVAGLLTDRYGRRMMFSVFLALSALMVGLFSLAETLAMLVFLRLVGWCLCSGMVPIVNSYVVEASPARFRGFNAGILQIGYPLGWFIGGLLAVELMGNPAIGRAVGGFLESLGLISAEAVQGAGSWRLIFMVAFLVIPIGRRFCTGAFRKAAGSWPRKRRRRPVPKRA